MKTKRGRPPEFPKAKRFSSDKPIVFYEKDDVLVLYKKYFPDEENRTSLTEGIAKWCDSESRKHGWAGAMLTPAVRKIHAGCLLFQRDSMDLTLNIIYTRNQEAS